MADDKRYDNQTHPRIRGRCPSCGAESLFLGSNGYVTCSVIGCKDPGAPTDLLEGKQLAEASQRIEALQAERDELLSNEAGLEARFDEAMEQLKAALARELSAIKDAEAAEAKVEAFENALLEPPSDHREHLHERVERECWKQHYDKFDVCEHPACELLKRIARLLGWKIELNGVKPQEKK